MSRGWLASLCLVAAAATVLLCCAYGGSLPTIPPPVPLGHTSPEYYTGPGAYSEIACSAKVLEAARMYYAKELMVYRTTKRPPTRDDVVALAKRLGIEVTPEQKAALPETQEERYLYYAFFDPWEIEVADDGRYRIADRNVDVRHDRTGPPISNARVRVISDAFLRGTTLLPKGSRFDGVRLRSMDGDTVEMLAARYTSYLGGLPCDGIGVDVTADGRVSAVWGRILEAKPAGRYPIITAEEALASFRAGEVQMMGPGGRVGERRSGVRYRAEVESMYIAYTGVAPYTATVSYLHPVYEIQAKVYDGERLLPDRLRGSVPAVKWEYLDERLLYAPYR